MAKRFTDTDIWDKEWFMSLNPTLKCLVKYVRDKCNIAGVWHPNFKLAATCIGEEVTEKHLISIDHGKQFLKLDCGKIFCIGFINFQYGESLNEKSPVHKKIIEMLKKHFYNSNTLFDTLFNRVCNTLKEEDKEEEEEKEKEEVKGGAGEFSLAHIQLDNKTLEAAEMNQWTLHKKKNTDFIKNSWQVFLMERVNDPPVKIKDYLKHHAKLYSHFLNWVRYKKPEHGAHKSTINGHSKESKPGTSDARINAAKNF